ncbi:MAG: hypothetical protein ABIP54_02195 [Candidatus Andersenbacteria bacterium]
MSGGKINLPTYVIQADQELYQDEFNQTLRQWFNSDGFFLPALTSAEVVLLMALAPTPVQKVWINSDLNKMQFLDTVGALQTVTST